MADLSPIKDPIIAQVVCFFAVAYSIILLIYCFPKYDISITVFLQNNIKYNIQFWYAASDKTN